MDNSNMTEREFAQQKYEIARKNLILMIILTVVNIALLTFESNTMLLFSATIPYMAGVFAMTTSYTVVATILIGIAAVTLILYLICWIFSKKHYGWMIVALVMFILDTLAMIGMYLLAGDVSGILDVVIHVWVLYYLVIGVKYGHQLRTLREEETASISDEAEYSVAANEELGLEESTPLYIADMSVKARILLEAEAQGHRICYRRVKRVNELVIDGYVYDKVEMLIEPAHTLVANLDGHLFTVGYDSTYSFFMVDNQMIVRKIRFW